MIVLVILLALAACSGQPTPEVLGLPTVAALPTLTATVTLTSVTPSATPTATATAAPTETPTVTVTPSATITDTPTPTASNTPLPTDTPAPTADNEGLLALALTAAFATVIPMPTAAPTAAGALPGVTVATTGCAFPPPGGFGVVFASDPTLVQQIGCPTPLGQAPITATVSSASQNYERGVMVWTQGAPPSIYALFSGGRFQRYDDTYNAGTDPASGGEQPPPGLIEPVRGFGKVWRTFPEVRGGLGWARDNEQGGSSAAQAFERGQMIALPQRGEILILIYDAGNPNSGTWRTVAGTF
ncbi:MAG: hypothetical protein HZC41_03795 [Chloroflexi bacterium]|nr:hypothetical protein [Chloroflexota bacterium]